MDSQREYEKTELSVIEQRAISGGPELARLFRWIAKQCLGVKFSLNELWLEHDQISFAHELAFYRALSPAELFRPPTLVPQVEASRPFRLTRGRIIDLRLPSTYIPCYPSYHDEFEYFTENRTIHARLWKHPWGTSLGTAVALHGWAMGDQRLNALALAPGFFFSLGLNVLIYELPLHGRRSPRSIPGSAALFPTVRIARINETVGQAIHDLRSIALWLKKKNEPIVGVYGTSIGGYLAALWGTLDPLAFVIACSPPVELAESIRLRLGPQCPIPAEQEVALESAFAVHSPLWHLPATPKRARMIVASRNDPFVPFKQIARLIEHWQEPFVHTFAYGHLPFLHNEKVHEFLRSVNLAHRAPLEIQLWNSSR